MIHVSRLWYALSWRTRNALLWLLMFFLLRFFWSVRGPDRIPDVISATRLRVVDGDTLVMRWERIRLLGIDAPELGQSCRRANRQTWPCGRAAKRQLVRLIGGRPVRCRTHGTGYYNRILAICKTGNKAGSRRPSLNAALVATGYAVARRKRWRPAERRAREAGLGIWNGTFTDPASWRKYHPSDTAPAGFWSRLWHWFQVRTGLKQKVPEAEDLP